MTRKMDYRLKRKVQMSFKSILLTGLVIASATFATQPMSQRDKWTFAHNSGWSISHKLFLMSEEDCFEDQVFKHFYISYAYYKLGNFAEASKVFERLDEMIRDEIANPFPLK